MEKVFRVRGESRTESAAAGIEALVAKLSEAEKAADKTDRALRKAGKGAEKTGRDFDLQAKKLSVLNLELQNKRARLAQLEAKSTSYTSSLMSGARAFGVWGAALGGAAYAADQLFQRSFKLQNIQANLPYSIEGSKKATMGLVDSFRLGQMAIIANNSGLAKSSEEYDRLTAAATRVAIKLGRDVDDAIERVTLGISKQEREILDELIPGLKHADKIYADLAKSLGKKVSELTSAEKQMAFNAEALKELEKTAAGVKIEVDDGTRAWLEMKTMLQDIADTTIPYVTKAIAGIPKIPQWLFDITGGSDPQPGDTKVRGMSITGLGLKPGDAGYEALIATERRKKEIQEHLDRGTTRQDAISSYMAKTYREEFDKASKAFEKELAKYNESLKITSDKYDDGAEDAAIKMMGLPKKNRGGRKKKRNEPMNEVEHARKMNEIRKEMEEAGMFQSWDSSIDIELERKKNANEQLVALEEAKQEALLNTKLNALELERELIGDEDTKILRQQEFIAREEQAIQESLDRRIAMLQEQGFKELEIEQLKEEKRQAHHNAEVQRISARRAARQVELQREVAINRKLGEVFQEVGNVFQGVNGLITGKSKEAVVAKAALEAMYLGIVSIKYFVEGAADIAGFNYVQGAGKIIAGGIAAAGAVKVMAEGAKAGGGGGSTRSGLGGGMSFGGGGAANSGAYGSSGSSSSRSGDVGPFSRGRRGVSAVAMDAQAAGSTGSSSSGGTTIYQFNGGIQTLATNDEDLGTRLTQVIDRAQKKVGRTN